MVGMGEWRMRGMGRGVEGRWRWRGGAGADSAEPAGWRLRHRPAEASVQAAHLCSCQPVSKMVTNWSIFPIGEQPEHRKCFGDDRPLAPSLPAVACRRLGSHPPEAGPVGQRWEVVQRYNGRVATSVEQQKKRKKKRRNKTAPTSAPLIPSLHPSPPSPAVLPIDWAPAGMGAPQCGDGSQPSGRRGHRRGVSADAIVGARRGGPQGRRLRRRSACCWWHGGHHALWKGGKNTPHTMGAALSGRPVQTVAAATRVFNHFPPPLPALLPPHSSDRTSLAPFSSPPNPAPSLPLLVSPSHPSPFLLLLPLVPPPHTLITR